MFRELRARAPGGAATVALLALVFVTMDWVTWDEAIGEGSADALEYEPMASAAPGLPDRPVSSAYAVRLPLHWTVGVLGDAPGLDTRPAYRLVGLGLVLGIAVVTQRLLQHVGLRGAWLVATLGMVLLNPYVLRPQLFAPAQLSDHAFVLATGIVMWALLTRRFRWVAAGMFLLAMSRQNALVIGPVVAVLVAFMSPWRETAARWRWARSALIVTIPIVVFAGLQVVTRSFSDPFEPSLPRDTILPLIGNPGGAGRFLAHLGRTAAPLIIPTAALAAAAVEAVRQGRRLARPPVEVIVGLSLAS